MSNTKIKDLNGELILPLKDVSEKMDLKEGDEVKISIIEDKNKKYFLIKKSK